jgi:hypothetical protein
MASTAPYSTVGPYKTGVWLIAKGGQGAVVDGSNLPMEGSGFQYYWLGSTQQQAMPRIWDALTKLGVHTGLNSPTQVYDAVGNAFGGKVGTVQTAPGGILGAIQGALQGGSFFTGPISLEGAAAGGAATAGAGATVGEAATAGLAAGGLAGLLGASSDMEKLLIRGLEALVGIALLILGLQALTGTGSQGNPVAAVRGAAKYIR